MPPAWKIGDGFAIRYGGYKDIQWFKGPDWSELTKVVPPVSTEMAVL